MAPQAPTLNELRELVARHRRMIKHAQSATERQQHEQAIAAWKAAYVRAECEKRGVCDTSQAG